MLQRARATARTTHHVRITQGENGFEWEKQSYLETEKDNWYGSHYTHRKNSPLIRIDGDAVQLQRTEYGQCQMDVELHGVRLAVREHEYLLNGRFTVSISSCLH